MSPRSLDEKEMGDGPRVDVGVALLVFREKRGADGAHPAEVRRSDRPDGIPLAGRKGDSLDSQGNITPAVDQDGAAVPAPADRHLVGIGARNGPPLAPARGVEGEPASARLNEDLARIRRKEPLRRAFRGDGPRLAA